MNDELLINLVERSSHLYDKSLKDYKNEKLKENSWVSIAEYLNSTPDSVKKRWGNLRDRFVRAYREYTSTPSSAEFSKKIDFIYFQSMIWLAPFIRKRKLTSSLKASEPSPFETTEIRVKTMLEEELETSSQSCSTPPPPKRKADTSRHSVTQAVESSNKIFENRFATMQTTNPSDMHFMQSIVEDMQVLSAAKKLKFKKEVMEVLIRYVEEDDV